MINLVNKKTPTKIGCRVDETRQPLSRKVPIASSKINPYRMIIVARLVILALFLRYRIMNPVHDAIGLWLTSIICEIWFAFSWILDQFPKWLPIDRETYLDRLSLRYLYFAPLQSSILSNPYLNLVHMYSTRDSIIFQHINIFPFLQNIRVM